MTSELFFLLAIMFIVIIAFALTQQSKHRHWLRREVLGRLGFRARAASQNPLEPARPAPDSAPGILASENEAKAELGRLRGLIEDRKKMARDADLSHHLWGLYESQFRPNSRKSLDPYELAGEWYEIKTLKVDTQGGLNRYEFELNGEKYVFVDDEDQQGWSDNLKYFSLSLFDASGRCLIEIPIKLKVDKWGSTYSIASGGPNAFVPGGWMNDFINVKLKHQRLRNEEIRAQKHRERLSEIEELKEKFGITD